MSQSLQRGMQILKLLAENRMSLSEVAAHLDVHKSTALRLLRSLEEFGMVRHNEVHEYRLGPSVFALGAQSLGSLDIRSIAASHLRKLANETKLTVHLGAFDGSEVIYIDKYETPGTVRMYSRIGAPAPLHCTGIAKAILAELPEQRLEMLLHDMHLTRHTDATITTVDKFLEELAESRERGFAVDNREHEDFVHCIAVPIRAAAQEVRFSISLTAPVFTIDWEQLLQLVPRLTSAAQDLAEELA